MAISTKLHSHGFLLNEGQFQTIDCPGDTFTFTSGLGVHGEVLGGIGSPDGTQHGVLVKDGNCTTIDYPGGSFTYLNAITPEGTIVGRYTSIDGKVHGFLLTRDE